MPSAVVMDGGSAHGLTDEGFARAVVLSQSNNRTKVLQDSEQQKGVTTSLEVVVVLQFHLAVAGMAMSKLSCN